MFISLNTSKPRSEGLRVAKQNGLTLIELMIAMTITLIMLLGLTVVMTNTHKQNRIQSGVQQVSESGRYAIEIISRDIRMAGYYGCVEDFNSMDTFGISTGVNMNTFTMHGYEHDTGNPGAVWYPTAVSANVIETIEADDLNSDSIVVRMASPVLDASGNEVTISPMSSTVSAVNVSDASNIAVGDMLLIGNCDQADIFMASSVAGDSISHQRDTSEAMTNSSDSLSAVYDSTASLYKFYSIQYQVRPDPANGNLPTLYRSVNGVRQPVIPGVDSMQLLYGEDTGGTPAPDGYFQADAVTNWSNVRTTRVSMLVRSEEEYGNAEIDRTALDVNPLTQAKTIQVGDYAFVDDGARVRRRVFETTVNIRNNI